MMDRSSLVQYALSALAHLDDPVSLAEHPLAPLLWPGRSARERGRALAGQLRAAIAELRPADRTETNLGALRRFQYLELRYLRGWRAAHVAQELGLSDRQARRIHQEAVEALAEVVWANRDRPADPKPPFRTAEAARAEPATSELDAEVSRLGAARAVEGTALAEALRSALLTVQPLAARHGLDLDVEPLPSLPLVAVDRAVLRQVLVNLLVASIDASVQQLKVEARPANAAVEVRFTARFRSRSGETSGAPSHDELLRVAGRLVQLQAGTLSATAADRTGQVITLAVPIAQPVTILLVDDNPDTLRLFRRYLSGGAYRPLEAGDARQALEIARQGQPRAVVLDVMLPAQDGWEILQALRHDLTTEHIPVIVCSVLHQEELAQALGAAAYLTKPVSRDDLLATLHRLRAAPAAGPAPPAAGR